MNYIKKAVKSSFAKSVLLISGGTACAQVVNTLFSPIIMRLYTPEDYGVLTVYTAILGMVAIIGTLKYELGIPIADDDEKAANMIALSTIVVIFFSGIIALLLFLWGDWFLNLFDGETLSKYRYLIPLGVLFTGFYTVFNQWAFRKKRFKDVSKTKVSQSIVQNVTKMGFGVIGAGPIGLIIGWILGQSVGITILARPFFKDHAYLMKKINCRKIIWSAKRYKQFPLFSAPGQILNSAGIQLPVFFITFLYGPEVIGFYGLANGIVNLPMTLIGRSVGDVYFAEAASIGQRNPLKLKTLSETLLKKLMLLGLIPLLLLLFFGPTLFALIFGSNWHEAGVYAQIIAFMVYTRFIFDPISRVFTVFERQRDALVLNIIRIFLILIVFGVAKWFSLSSYKAVALYAGSMMIVYFLTYVFAQKILNNAIERSKTSI